MLILLIYDFSLYPVVKKTENENQDMIFVLCIT